MITLSVQGSQVIAKFERLQAGARMSLVRAINIATLELERYIKTTKLRGGNPLFSRSGNLSRAVHSIPAQDVGGRIVGRVAVDGTAPYARFQEYGVAHSWEINARPKGAPKGGLIGPTNTGGVLAFTIGGAVVFAKHVTHPGLKARSFMRSALEEKRAGIIEQLRAAVRDQMRGN